MSNTSEKTRDLERISIGAAVMFGIYWVYSLFIKERLALSTELKMVIGLAVLYGIGLALFLAISKSGVKNTFSIKTVSAKTTTVCFLLQFTALFVMVIFTTIVSALGGETASTDVLENTPFMIFVLLFFAPIAEEFVHRYLFAKKLLRYGERFYIFTSAFCFAIVHGLSLGIPQIVYTFILGMIWTYLFVKTNNFLLVAAMHGMSNLFGSVLTRGLKEISLKLSGVYVVLLLCLAVVGLVLFLKNKKKIVLDDSTGLIDGKTVKEVLTNKGIILFTVFTICMMVLKWGGFIEKLFVEQ